MRLGIEDQLFEFSHQLTLAREIGLPQHAVVEFDLCWILVVSKIRTRDRVRQVFGPIEQRVDDVLAFAIERRIEFALPQRLGKRARRQHALGHLDANFAPFVYDPGCIELVGLVDIAV